MTDAKKISTSRAIHCGGCGLPLHETCLPGCPERDAFYASYDRAVQGARPRGRGDRS